MIFNGVKKAVMEDDHVKHCYVLLYNTVVFNIVMVFVLGYISCICECIRVNVRLTPRTPRMHARRLSPHTPWLSAMRHSRCFIELDIWSHCSVQKLSSNNGHTVIINVHIV